MMTPFPKVNVRDALAAKFKSLGVEGDSDLMAFLRIIRRAGRVGRGRDITAIDRRSAVLLLDGVACWYRRPEGGRRQILAFQYPGDLLDFHGYVLPGFDEPTEIRALTNCWVGIAHYDDIENAIDQHPNLGLALWRTTMLTALIWRERMLHTVHSTALSRVAHLLCEQLARLEAVGISGTTIPLSQNDVADAAGLSPVHVRRTIQQLRKAGALLDSKGAITVANRDRLIQMAKFDPRYLNVPALLSNWQVNIGPSVA
jgi:CRP-like cAMP-binding protein